MNPTLTTAVIPAAGYGTRMAAITGGRAKEMLPINGLPIIHHVVQEALAAGIARICIVIRTDKEEIQHYFEEGASLASGMCPGPLLREQCDIGFVTQEQPNGLGDALLCARDFVGCAPFAMLIPDQLFFGSVPALTQLTSKDLPSNAVISSLISVSEEELRSYPGARLFQYEPTNRRGVVRVTRIEKAGMGSPLACTGRVACGFGRTIYPPEVFSLLGDEYADPQTGEVDLFLTFKRLLLQVPSYGVFLEGQAFDLGTAAAYLDFISCRTSLSLQSPE
jgi:UTP--glucose-1-phosphate uridylyltransferase